MAELLRKRVNAKLRGARGRGIGVVITDGMGKLMGGTWVGVNVVLTDESLAFSANKLNRIVQTGELDAEFPLDQITGARISGGFGTKIISVDLADGTEFQFRCTGAKEALGSLLAAIPNSD